MSGSRGTRQYLSWPRTRPVFHRVSHTVPEGMATNKLVFPLSVGQYSPPDAMKHALVTTLLVAAACAPHESPGGSTVTGTTGTTSTSTATGDSPTSQASTGSLFEGLWKDCVEGGCSEGAGAMVCAWSLVASGDTINPGENFCTVECEQDLDCPDGSICRTQAGVIFGSKVCAIPCADISDCPEVSQICWPLDPKEPEMFCA